MEANSVAGGRLLIHGSNGIFESLDQGATINLIGASLGSNNITVNALANGGRKNNVSNANVVWAASGSNVFYRSSGTRALTVTPSATTSTVRDLTIDRNDFEIGAIVTSNQVIRTTNAGANWSNITGNLLAQAREIFSIAHIAGAFGGWLAVGTNVGVFVSAMAQLGTWNRLGSGLPNTLAYDVSSDLTSKGWLQIIRER